VAKSVFFSFYDEDVIDFRANVVRQHWLTKPDREAAGFFDASIWGKAELSGDIGIKRVIEDAVRRNRARLPWGSRRPRSPLPEASLALTSYPSQAFPETVAESPPL
jgi:hypothetical protein